MTSALVKQVTMEDAGLHFAEDGSVSFYDFAGRFYICQFE